MIMTLIIENDDEQSPSQDDLAYWAETYGQTFPVLSDPKAKVVKRFGRSGIALPAFTLIGPGAEVLLDRFGKPDMGDIESALP